jgi:hypothetical protein
LSKIGPDVIDEAGELDLRACLLQGSQISPCCVPSDDHLKRLPVNNAPKDLPGEPQHRLVVGNVPERSGIEQAIEIARPEVSLVLLQVNDVRHHDTLIRRVNQVGKQHTLGLRCHSYDIDVLQQLPGTA